MTYRRFGRRLATLAVLLITCSCGAYAQTTWYVDDDAPSDPGPGNPASSDPLEDGSTLHPFDAIQEGIDAATAGDTVVVLDGTYAGLGNKNLDYAGKAITVQSDSGAANCIIDCQNSGRGFYFQSGETDASVLDGFTIQNGNVVWGDPGDGRGGGINCFYYSAPTIKNCLIRWNQAEQDGGGIFCDWAATPMIVNCTVDDNSVGDYGGGIACYNGSDATIVNCTVSNNQGIAGSGIACFGASPSLSGCWVLDNTASGGG